jgi:hypothetical protein
LFTSLAVAATAVLCTTEDFVQGAWLRLSVAVGGSAAAFLALIFGLVALLVRRKAWPLGFFTMLVSLGVFWFLIPQMGRPLREIAAKLNRSALAGQDHDGLAQAQSKIAQAKSADTMASVQPSLIAWGEEAMVKSYDEHGRHDEKWDKPVRDFIHGMALELAGGSPWHGLKRLSLLGAEIKRTGCNDPWVLFLIRRLNNDDPDFGDAMRQSVAALNEYGPFPQWLARAEVVRAERTEGLASRGKLDPACLEALRNALSAKPLTKGDLEAWLNIFEIEPGGSVLKQDADGVCKTIESIAGIPAWFPLAVRGRAEIDLAWEARGSGWANSVSQAQWQQFEEHLQLAREALEKSSKLAPDQPQPACRLITVALGSEGIEEMRRHFDAVLASRFDYIPAYDAFRQGLLPRWHGSEEAVLGFGRNCLSTQRFDTGVPWQLLRAVYSVADDQDDEGEYYARRAPWKELNAMFAGYLAHGDPGLRNYYLSTQLVMTARAGRDGDVGKLLKDLNYEIDPQVKEDWNLSVNYVGRMTALSGPAADAVLAALRMSDKQPAEALQKMRAAQKTSGLPPAAASFIAREADELGAIVSLEQSQWQPLVPAEEMTGWKTVSGQWKVVSPGVLEVATEDSGALLTRLAPVGQTWEVRGEFVLKANRPGRVEAAIFCGPPDDQKQHGFSVRFWRRITGKRSSGVSLARGFGEDAVSKKATFEETVPFFIRLENGHIRVRSGDDDQWFADQSLPEGATVDSGALLSLGTTAGGVQTVQFRNLEWRAPEPSAK